MCIAVKMGIPLFKVEIQLSFEAKKCQLSKAPHFKSTGSNRIKLVARDRGTHYLGIVIVFIRIEAIFF